MVQEVRVLPSRPVSTEQLLGVLGELSRCQHHDQDKCARTNLTAEQQPTSQDDGRDGQTLRRERPLDEEEGVLQPGPVSRPLTDTGTGTVELGGTEPAVRCGDPEKHEECKRGEGGEYQVAAGLRHSDDARNTE